MLENDGVGALLILILTAKADVFVVPKALVTVTLPDKTFPLLKLYSEPLASNIIDKLPLESIPNEPVSLFVAEPLGTTENTTDSLESKSATVPVLPLVPLRTLEPLVALSII